MDRDSSFISSLMNHLFGKIDRSIKTVALYNHHSLQAEHVIKSLSTILTKCDWFGSNVAKILAISHVDIYKTFHSLNVANCHPYELGFGRKPKLLSDLETNPDIKVSGTFKDYYVLLNKR